LKAVLRPGLLQIPDLAHEVGDALALLENLPIGGRERVSALSARSRQDASAWLSFSTTATRRSRLAVAIGSWTRRRASLFS
jgi:hypothetical protein